MESRSGSKLLETPGAAVTWLLLCFIIFSSGFAVHPTSAIDCHVCAYVNSTATSRIGPSVPSISGLQVVQQQSDFSCRDLFDRSSPTVSIERNCKACMKTKTVVQGKQIAVGRQCVILDIMGEECTVDEAGELRVQICSCKSNLCNGASSPHHLLTFSESLLLGAAIFAPLALTSVHAFH